MNSAMNEPHDPFAGNRKRGPDQLIDPVSASPTSRISKEIQGYWPPTPFSGSLK